MTLSITRLLKLQIPLKNKQHKKEKKIYGLFLVYICLPQWAQKVAPRETVAPQFGQKLEPPLAVDAVDAEDAEDDVP